MVEPGWDTLVAHATAGDREALDALVRGLQDRVYRLSYRMLGNPADAADATQEILLRIVTHLGSFRGEAAFPTWVHRVAANHLLTVRARRAGGGETSFEALGAMIDGGLGGEGAAGEDAGGEGEPSRALLAAEVRLTCTEAMLMCLDAGHRLAFVLGEIVEMPGDEAAWVLELSHDAYRQRLARARATITAFVKKRCGVFSAANPCRCARQIPQAVRLGMLDPARLVWGLARTSESLGVRLHEDTRVTGFETDGAGVRVRTEWGSVHAGRVVIGTNAYRGVLKRFNAWVLPVYDHVLMTEPLAPDQLASIGWQGREGLTDAGREYLAGS